MFSGLSSTPTDLFNVAIPILRRPPEKRIDIQEPHRPFTNENIFNVIASNTSSTYISLINRIGLENISFTTFPSKLSFLPAMIFKGTDENGIVLNIDLCSASFDLDKQKVKISEASDFAACLLYGLNKLICSDITDDGILNQYYNSLVIYAYSLLVRNYSRDFDIMRMTDQELASIFYLIAKFICTEFFEFSGNEEAVALGVVNKFFTRDEKRVKFQIDTNQLPDDPANSWDDIFKALDLYDIMPGLSVEDFRNRITRFYGLSGVVAMSAGLEAVSMLNSVNIASSVFHKNLASINPGAIRYISKATTSYLREYIQQQDEEDKINDLSFLDNIITHRKNTKKQNISENSSDSIFHIWTKERVEAEGSKYSIFEYKNVPIFIQMGYNEWDDQPWTSLFLPSDVSNPYDYEGITNNKTNKLTTGKIMWRDLHTSPPDEYLSEMINGDYNHNNNSYGWESLEGTKDLHTAKSIINISKKQKYYLETINNVDCYVMVMYSDSNDKYQRYLRIVQYGIKNIKDSRWLQDGAFIVSASRFVHDYTHFRTLRSAWKYFPMLPPKD
jgi:hypothetical protein